MAKANLKFTMNRYSYSKFQISLSHPVVDHGAENPSSQEAGEGCWGRGLRIQNPAERGDFKKNIHQGFMGDFNFFKQ